MKMEWIIYNKEWLFSGIGVLAISLFIHMVIKRGSQTQHQKSGSQSTNYQANGDINITNPSNSNLSNPNISTSVNLDQNLSKQAINIIQQFEERQASKLVQLEVISQEDVFQFFDGKGGNLAIEEQRYINDDLKILVECSYLTHEINEQGYNLYRITRNGSNFVTSLDKKL